MGPLGNDILRWKVDTTFSSHRHNPTHECLEVFVRPPPFTRCSRWSDTFQNEKCLLLLVFTVTRKVTARLELPGLLQQGRTRVSEGMSWIATKRTQS